MTAPVLSVKTFIKRLSINDTFTNLLLGISVALIVATLIYDYVDKNYHKQQITPQAARIAEMPSPTEILGDNTSEFPKKYLIKDGEDLWKIAIKEYGFGEAWTKIAAENGIKNPNLILSGDVLNLPVIEKPQPIGQILTGISIEAIEGNNYTVQKGDTLFSIAERAFGDGREWTKLKSANNIRYPNHIEVGQTVAIPR